MAKITEALAKVYYANVLRKGYDITPIAKAYTIASRLCPNYRLILKGKPGFEKYAHLTDFGAINSNQWPPYESRKELNLKYNNNEKE